MKFVLKKSHDNISDQDLLNDLRRVATINSKDTLTTREYRQSGIFNVKTIYRRFGSWANALERADLVVKSYSRKNDITDSDLIFEIERLWIKLGRQPTTTDIKNGLSKYSLNTFTRRYGGWMEMLEETVKHINSDENTYGNEKIPVQMEISHYSIQKFDRRTVPRNNTKRDPNYRLRFKVMQRDNFKCCACGASPAKDPSVELHVDHIVPWSKGGATVIENLQTLCSKCNLGKGDME